MLLAIQIIGAILIFSILIVVHEFGHFIFAKKFGVIVHEFAIGMGPKLWGKQKGETLYSIRLFPVGGYCKMEGEDEDSENSRSFTKLSWWKKVICLAAGGVFNLLLGLLLCVALSSFSQIPVAKVEKTTNPMLKTGDIILSIDGEKIYYQNDVFMKMSLLQKTEETRDFNVVVKRDGETENITVSAKYSEEYGRYMFGYESGIEKPAFFNGIKYGFYQFYAGTKATILGIVGLVTGKLSVKQVSGPVGISYMIGSAVGDAVTTTYGWGNLASIFLQITIGLGIFNLIPFPALDGGRICFVLFSAIARRKISATKEGYIHFAGIVVLMSFILFVTCIDISRFFQ